MTETNGAQGMTLTYKNLTELDSSLNRALLRISDLFCEDLVY